MPGLTITAKGQITLKRELLRRLGISPGQQLQVHKLADDALALQATAPHGLEAFAGCLPPPGTPALSVEDMNAVISQGWAGQR